jgi:radical SAM superfamily enzyme YgiQ (UPF0313 family)
MAHNITIGFVQINSSFAGQDYFPLSVGLLQAYLQKNTPANMKLKFIEPVGRRAPPGAIARRLAAADIAGFSTYVWNQQISLAAAKRLKALNPRVLIVFGGPQVPNRAEKFLRLYPFVDLVCHGEGEEIFTQIVARHAQRDWSGIQSVSYLDADGKFRAHAQSARIPELSALPSPYLEGVFDSLAARRGKRKWLGLWETNRGCPYQCAFCEWGARTFNRVFCFDMERLRAEIRWFAEHKIEFIFCCDANFGLFPRDLEIAEMVAEAKRKYGYPHAFSVQSSKNAPERIYRIQKLLNDQQLSKGALLALQSATPKVLDYVHRKNIAMETFDELQRCFQREEILTFTDMIIGLPGETYASFVRGVDQIIAKGQHNRIQFINLSILGNSVMGDHAYQKKFGFEIVKSRIYNIHGEVSSGGETPEMQELVVATRAMPKRDWVRTRTFCWMTSLVYFDKLLQIPLALLHKYCGIKYRDLLECFMNVRVEEYPLMAETRTFFEKMARAIQSGGPEYCRSRDWLDIWWPADEYVLIKLCIQGKLDKFYAEAGELLLKLVLKKKQKAPFLNDALRLNRYALKQMYPPAERSVALQYNVWEMYRAVIEGRAVALRKGRFVYKIDRSGDKWKNIRDWCRNVVWYQNKKGAYLNPIISK